MARKERRFTFESGKSSKFWNIRVDGESLTVRFGRIGTEGQEKTNKFDDALAAERAADKLVREKTAKGFKNTVPGLAKPPPSYVEFVSPFAGTGEWHLIYQKRTWPLYFNLERHHSRTRTWLDSIYATEAPHKATRVGKLIPFASDGSETSYCWYSNCDQRGRACDPCRGLQASLQHSTLGPRPAQVIQHYRPTGFTWT